MNSVVLLPSFQRALSMNLMTKLLTCCCLAAAIGLQYFMPRVVGQSVDEPLPTSYEKALLLTPTKEYAAKATVLGFSGEPVAIRMQTDSPMLVTQRIRPRDRRNSNSEGSSLGGIEYTDANGLFKPSVLEQTCHSVFAFHESGCLFTERKAFESGHYVKLQPWQSYSGRIELNEKPLSSGTVIARWESFPHHPSILSLPAKSRHKGPALISLEAAATVEGGKFNFPKLPWGEIRFMVLPDLTPTDPRIWQSSSNLIWWKDFNEDSFGSSGEMKSFDAFTIAGQIKANDELQALRNDFAASSFRRNSRRLDLQVSFWLVASAGSTSTVKDPLKPSLAEAVLLAKEWNKKRKDPEGFIESYPGFKAVVDAQNRFLLTVLKRGVYVGEAFLQDEEFPDTFAPLSEMIASADSEKADRKHRLDLGGIDLTGKLQDYSRRTDSQPLEPTKHLKRQELTARSQAPSTRESDETSDRGLTRRHNQSEPSQSPRLIEPTSDDDFQKLLENKFGRQPNQSNPFSSVKQDSSPVDKAIAELVTGLLSAGDARTRENLKKPLETLLEQKFDAEQQARESIVAELQKRLKAAELKVQERATNKAAIIEQQLQRMMGLPEDGFLSMGPVRSGNQEDASLSSLFRAEALKHLKEFEQRAPFESNFNTANHDRAPIDFKDYNGRVRLVFVWNASNLYCQQQLPALVKLQSEFEKYGFQVLGLHSSLTEMLPEQHRLLKQAVQKAKVNFPCGSRGDAMQVQIPGLYLQSSPELIFIDSTNSVRLHVTEVKNYDYCAAIIEALLKEASRDRLQETRQ